MTVGTSTSVRAATIDLLRHRGMTTIFGNPGSTELGLLVDLPDDFRYVLALHESVAVAMADGYAQATGRPAFLNLHSACGVGNAMGAVVNAFHNRAPLVITGGNQDRRHLALEPYLFARGVELMAPYVKHSEQPARAEDVPAAIDRAWALPRPARTARCSSRCRSTTGTRRAAQTGRRAGGIEACAPRPLRMPARSGAGPLADPRPGGAGDRGRRRSRRRVGRARRAGRAPRGRRVGGAAVAAARLPRGSPAVPRSPRAGLRQRGGGARRHRGRAGASARRCSRSCPTSRVDQPLPAIVQLTDDPDEAARAPSVLSVIGDVRAIVVARCSSGRPASGATGRRGRRTPRRPAGAAGHDADLAGLPDGHARRGAPGRRGARGGVAVESPRPAPARPDPPAASFFATASGGLGFAMPAAVGIKLAQPERPVVCLVGDGSALYAPQALWSAVQLGRAGHVHRGRQRAVRDPRVGGRVRRSGGRAEPRGAGRGFPRRSGVATDVRPSA